MNCPYCDESIHLMAKFCPKCGLPLKDDATLMGAYTDEDGGPKKWVIAGGAAAIVVVALGIGLMTARGGQAREVVRREKVGVTAPSFRAGTGARVTPLYRPAATYPAAAHRSFTPSRTYSAPLTSAFRPSGSGSTRWAFDAAKYRKPAPAPPQPEPLTPGHALAWYRAVPKAPMYAVAAQPDMAAIPMAPPLPLQPVASNSSVTIVPQPGIPMAPDPIFGGNLTLTGGQLTPSPAQEMNGLIFDPVQGRYVRPGDQQPRGLDVNSSFAGRRRDGR